MTEPLTMTAEQEAGIRDRQQWGGLHPDDGGDLLAELDATRARLAEAEAALRGLWASARICDKEDAMFRCPELEAMEARLNGAPERPA